MGTIPSFRTPTTINFGAGVSAGVGHAVRQLSGSKVLLVTGPNVLASGLLDSILQGLAEEGVDVVVYDGINEEPTTNHVNEGLRLLTSSSCDSVIACGGGSPIDAAKAIAIMATHQGKIEDYGGLGKFSAAGLPLIAIPMTAGTGSEATTVAIITDPDSNLKMLINSPQLMPTIAMVDPLLTLSLPSRITAGTGLDALTHAIEAYVSKKAQPLTDVLALSAIALISKHLPEAWKNPGNIEARTQTMLGALQAGMAFNNSSVALVHGMSRPLGANFHIPHGIANAVLLGAVSEFSLSGAPQRYADIATAMGVTTGGISPMETAHAGIEKIKGMVVSLEIPTLSGCGVSKDRLDAIVAKMAEDAIASGSPGNNPRKADKEDISALYCAAL